jgi:hypothetical protein
MVSRKAGLGTRTRQNGHSEQSDIYRDAKRRALRIPGHKECIKSVRRSYKSRDRADESSDKAQNRPPRHPTGDFARRPSTECQRGSNENTARIYFSAQIKPVRVLPPFDADQVDRIRDRGSAR